MRSLDTLFTGSQCLLARHLAEAHSGVTQHEDYEGLILHFSDIGFKDSDDDRLQIFVYSFIGWLSDSWAFVTSKQAIRVLEEMTRVAQAILRRGRRTYHYGQNDAA